jgi:hypothetical protein
VSVLRVHRHRRDFTVLGNPTLRDGRLSFRARGVLAFLLSQPDGYPVNAAEIARQGKEGRDAIETAIRELRACGYVLRRKEQNDRGQWVTYTDVFEVPEQPQQTATDNGFSGAGADATEPWESDAGNLGAIEKERVEKEQDLAPTVLTPDGVTISGGEVIPLRSNQAVQAANGTLSRLKAEVQAGKRSWSLSEAAKAEWLALLDQVDTKPGPPQQFVIFYLSANTGRDVRSFSDFHWKMAGQKVRRWRGLVLYGVDQAITHVEPDERDERGYAGRPFWAYVERVCQRARADTAGGSP